MNGNSQLQIGFAYDPPPEEGSAQGLFSAEAEYEDPQTIDWIRGVLSRLGTVWDLPWSGRFVEECLRYHPDVIFNITEARVGRNRESLVPAVAEALQIPCTGSDAMGMGLSLDKGITKLVARKAGIPTPAFITAANRFELERTLDSADDLRYPLIVKPNLGGSSFGIRASSKVFSRKELLREAEWVFQQCRDHALVETFVSGREYAAAILEREVPRVLPIAEIRIGSGDPEEFYYYDKKSRHEKEVLCPAELTSELKQAMERSSLKLFDRMGFQDLARVDFRVDAAGTPWLLEVNPLPGLSPFYSVYPLQAKAAGISSEDIIYQLIENALRGTTWKPKIGHGR
jgi:D-alanine--D-alanine ligase